MKHYNDEDKLKHAAQNFDVPHHADVFDLLMHKRVQQQQEKKRKRILYVFMFATVLFMGIGGALFTHQPTQLVDTTTNLTEPKEPQNKSQLNKNTAIQTRENDAPSQSFNLNKQRKSAVINHSNEIEAVASQLAKKELRSEWKKININEKTQIEPANESEQTSTKRKRQDDGGVLTSSQQNVGDNEQAKETDVKDEINTSVLVLNQDSIVVSDSMPNQDIALVIPANADSLSNLYTDSISQNTSRASSNKHSFKIMLYGVYHPITNAENNSSHLMYNLADSFGLTNKARYAYGTGLKLGYQINTYWLVYAGVGFYQVLFDEVRNTPHIVVDTFTRESLTVGNVVNKKRVYLQDIAERSMSWLEIPLHLRYVGPSSKKIAMYTDLGLVYQTLLQHKAYMFDTDSMGVFQHKSVTDMGTNRINKHQFVLAIEPGVMWNITPNIQFNIGVSYRKNLSVYYQKDYISNKAPWYLGATGGLQWNF